MTRAKVSAHLEKLENMTEENRAGSVCGVMRNLYTYKAPRSPYLGLYDITGFEGLKIAIFLSILSGFPT